MANRTTRTITIDAVDKASLSREDINLIATMRQAPDAVLVLFADSPFTPLVTDGVILCDCTGGAITINLPPLADTIGTVLAIKKVDVSANAVTIDADGSETIDFTTTKTLAARGDRTRQYPDPTYGWVNI